jgi:membrane-bound inhibitor of C-type lysozyme
MGLFNLFNKSTPEKPQDVKTVREALLLFIKQELQKMEGGEGSHIKGIELFVCCLPGERFMYDSAVFFEDSDRFRNEVQRIADDFAIDLPQKWTMQVSFVEELPAQSIKMKGLEVALAIKTPEHIVAQKSSTAYIRILNGEAEKKVYTIHAEDGRINIGRDKKTQDNDGFVRENNIAFPDSSSSAGNKYISRQHAHIEWSKDASAFVIFADDGGVPPRNKVKVKSHGEHNTIKLTFTELGHTLLQGDQIILGESAVLEFTYHIH